jgi:DmsE family decaheme c-type cytochrome
MRVGRREPTRTQARRCRPFAAVMLLVATGTALFGVSAPLRAHDAVISDDPIARLRDYVQHLAPQTEAPTVERANVAPSEQARDKRGADVFADLRTFVQGIHDSAPQPAGDQIKVAADNAFDALREFLQRNNGTPPVEQAPTSPRPPVLAPKAPLADPIVEPPLIVANNVGSNVCLGCHAAQADSFGYTLMGRLQKQGKMGCETCHGPGSAHVRSVGCAACHGDGGITTRPGIPSLVGLDPQYLVVAMKEYVSGQRKHAMMKALLSGLGDAELNNIAFYYARQPAARAETPLVGNPSKSGTAACAACHGENGIAVSPAFPNLAGQDSQYLADAMRAYKVGARNKVVACAACHGDRGISKTPGTPSLVGLETQYLVAAMKAYASGQRKNAVMKALLSGVGDAELNNMAIYYAQQTPARAPTPSVGDAAAGKSAAAVCLGCHVAQGASPNPAWPSLAGQDAKYLADATEAYKDGSRSDETMKAIVASLDRQTFNNIAAYYASLTPEEPASGKNTAKKSAPSISANRVFVSLDQRAIDNVASYYASLTPAQPESKNAPARAIPAFVRASAPVGGLSVGGIISFRANDPGRTAEQNNHICLNCHERGERTYWQGSVHEERGVACTNCHTVMANVSARFALKTAFQPDTCFQCHKDRRAQMFRSSHMPVREGKIVCSDCHNPHGSFTEAMLRTNTINETCYKCHAEKRGPFLFEHMPVRENCDNCHDPHGSMNEASLKVSKPRLCFECHTIGPHGNLGTTGPLSDLTMSKACTNCHTQIHGSNSPAGGAFHR